MKNLKKKIKQAIELEFCKALNLSNNGVTEAMNSGPCFLGSKKHFEVTAYMVLMAIKTEIEMELDNEK